MNASCYSVFRDNLGDSTGGGLSSYVDTAIMFSGCSREEALRYCEEHDIDPALQFFLEKRVLWGEDHSVAVPLLTEKEGCRMFGGNFLYTSNSNSYHFDGERVTRPIPIHDRFEDAYIYSNFK